MSYENYSINSDSMTFSPKKNISYTLGNYAEMQENENENDNQNENGKTTPTYKMSKMYQSSLYIGIKQRYTNVKRPSMNKRWRTMVKKYDELLEDRKDLVEKVEKDMESTPEFKRWRWIVLICIMIIYFAGYLSFDSIAAIEDNVKTTLNITSEQLGIVYSVYNFPNTVMVIVGGVLFDKLGVRKSTMLYISLLLTGSLISAFALGPLVKSYYLLLFGRFIYGLGAESTYIAVDSILAMWWDGKNLAFAMGLQVAAGRLGDVIGYSVLPIIATKIGTAGGVWICSFIVVLSFFAAIGFCLLDRRAEKFKKVLEEEYNANEENIITESDVDKTDVGLNLNEREDDDQEFLIPTLKSQKNVEEKYSCSKFGRDMIDSMKQVKNFNLLYWLVTIIVTIYFCCVYTFMGFAENLLLVNYGYGTEDAGKITSVVSASALVLSPLFGVILDKFGHRGHAVLVSSYGLTLAFIIFSISQNVILMYVAMGLIGIAFSLVSAGLWPCITLLVDEDAYGVAFGIMGGGINTASLLVNYLLGYFISKNQMAYAVLVWVLLASLSVLFSIWWNILDKKRGGDAQKPSSELEE